MVGGGEDKKRRRPSAIELAATELVIQWMDGAESRIPLAALRGSCPCAMCRQARDQEVTGPSDELSLLTGEAATATAKASGFDFVGRYGIRINWADGHNTGIYTFESLREDA